MQALGAFQGLEEAAGKTGRLDQLGHLEAEVGAERLPLDGEHPMALEVPERPVVGHDVEPVGSALERPSGAVAAIGALSDVRLEDPAAPSAPRAATRSGDLVLGEVRGTGSTSRRAPCPRPRGRSR